MQTMRRIVYTSTQALTKKTENNVNWMEHDAIYELHEYNPMNIMQYI